MESRFGANLKARREALGMSQQQLADAAGVSQVTIFKIEKGANTRYAARLARALDTTVEELEAGGSVLIEQDESRPGAVPLISSVQAGAWSEIVDNFQPGDAEAWLPCPVPHGPNTFCLTVDGESMSNPNGRPSYDPGDIIFVDPGRAAQPGDRIVARLENQRQATFKQYVEEDGRKLLKALNPAWAPRFIEIDDEATVCGVVIGKWVPN